MRLAVSFACTLFAGLALPAATVSILTTDGKTVEGETSRGKITLETGGVRREIPLSKLLSLHSGAPLSERERGMVETGIPAVLGADRAKSDLGVEQISAIGPAAITPLLQVYKDTDQHEPNPLYRLFTRIIPPSADGFDRALALVRLTDGTALRGNAAAGDWVVNGTTVPSASVRRVAVKQKLVRRNMEVHSLRHSNQIEFLDTGVVLTQGSAMESAATGFARLSWHADDWACDPDGLKKPAGNYKTHLVNGHPFGALVGRLGAAGEMFFVGKSYRKSGGGAGKLQLAVNDNRHWQNNLGSYRVVMSATDAYDVGDAF